MKTRALSPKGQQRETVLQERSAWKVFLDIDPHIADAILLQNLPEDALDMVEVSTAATAKVPFRIIDGVRVAPATLFH